MRFAESIHESSKSEVQPGRKPAVDRQISQK